MLAEVLEKYSKDIFDIPVWEWLDIKQVTWSVQKKNGLSKNNMSKIDKHFGFSKKDTERIKVREITDRYYSI